MRCNYSLKANNFNINCRHESANSQLARLAESLARMSRMDDTVSQQCAHKLLRNRSFRYRTKEKTSQRR